MDWDFWERALAAAGFLSEAAVARVWLGCFGLCFLSSLANTKGNAAKEPFCRFGLGLRISGVCGERQNRQITPNFVAGEAGD